MYTIYYQSVITPGVVHETYARTIKEAQEMIQNFKESGYGAWLKDHNC